MEEIETVRVVIFKECDSWVAQCLEYDIGVQADDIDSLRRRFEMAMNAELQECMERGALMRDAIAPAPAEFVAMWERRSGRFEPEVVTRFNGRSLTPEFGLVA